MKSFLLFLLASFFVMSVKAQARWTVQLNSKVLLTANEEDTLINRVSINELKKGSLLITYIPGKTENERKRKLAVYDANDNQLYAKEAFNINIPAATLKKWRRTMPQLKVYTWPVLEQEGANVRLRRVHLCTLNFK